jgi:hypothetical protein
MALVFCLSSAPEITRCHDATTSVGVTAWVFDRTVCSWPFREALIRKVQGLAPVIYFFSRGIIRVDVFHLGPAFQIKFTIDSHSIYDVDLVGTDNCE